MLKVFLYFSLVATLCSGCYLSKEYPVEYDYNYLGNYEAYESFAFFRESNSLPESSNALIEATITRHLQLLGYKYDKVKPSFYVSYAYIDDSVRYRGYQQPTMENFLRFSTRNKKQEENYFDKNFNIKNGTLIINFTEASNYSMVWQGYTTDLYEENIFNDPRKVRVAVLSILKNYSHLPSDEKK